MAGLCIRLWLPPLLVGIAAAPGDREGEVCVICAGGLRTWVQGLEFRV